MWEQDAQSNTGCNKAAFQHRAISFIYRSVGKQDAIAYQKLTDRLMKPSVTPYYLQKRKLILALRHGPFYTIQMAIQ